MANWIKCEEIWITQDNPSRVRNSELGITPWFRFRYLCDKLQWKISDLTQYLGRDISDYSSRTKGKLFEKEQQQLLDRVRSVNWDYRHIPQDFFSRPLPNSIENQLLPWKEMDEVLDHFCRYGFVVDRNGPGLAGAPKPQLEDRSPHLESSIKLLLSEMDQFLSKSESPQVFVIYGEAERGQSMLLGDFLQSHSYSGYRVCYVNCQKLSSYPSLVNYIYQVVMGKEGSDYLDKLYHSGQSNELNQSLLEREIFHLGAELQKENYLFIFDNFHTVQFSALTHVIRDDAVYDLLKFVLLESEKTKIIISSTHQMNDIVEGEVINSELMVCPKNELLDSMIQRFKGLNDNSVKAIRHIVSKIEEPHINRSLMCIIYSLLLVKADASADIVSIFESYPRHLERIKNLLALLIANLKDEELIVLYVISMNEDKIEHRILIDVICKLGFDDFTHIDKTIKHVVKMLSPILESEVKTGIEKDESNETLESEAEYSISYFYRNFLISFWENGDKAILARRAHSFLAENSLKDIECSPNQDVIASIRELRLKFIFVMHLLASINPDELSSGEDGVKKVKDCDFIDAQHTLFSSQSAGSTMCYAYEYVKLELELGSEHSLSRNLGADEEKLALYLCFFHPGFTRPPSGHYLYGPDKKLPSLPSVLELDEQADLLTSVAVSALRSHALDICHAATIKAKEIYEQLREEPQDTNDSSRGHNQVAKIVKIQLDMLIRQGRLAEAKTWGFEQLNDFAVRSGAKAVKSIESFINQDFPIPSVYRVLAPRLAEALFLGGNLKEALDIYNRIISRFKEGEFGLTGRPTRSYIRLLVRMACISKDENDRKYYTRRAKDYLRFAKIQQTARQFVNDRAALVMLESMLQRLDKVPYQDVIDTMSKAREKTWAGRVSPMLRLQMALENARAYIYSAKSTENERDSRVFLRKADMHVSRVFTVAKQYGYRLYECDAALIKAELTNNDLERKELINSVTPIIDSEYGLREFDKAYLLSSKRSAVLHLVF